tara:strand:- start:1885 stop:2010 length:126 start_codon:yes stop_codon:yes gene_type:complete
MDDPIKWANAQVERAVYENLNKYLDAKALGESFWDEVKNNN